MEATAGLFSRYKERAVPTDRIFKANRSWSARMLDADPGFFSRHVEGQKPEVLWFGCSDSRVSVGSIANMPPGVLFVQRNIGNMVDTESTAVMSAVQYAVDVLEVPCIVVCGHAECGAMKAVLSDKHSDGPLGEWLNLARTDLQDVLRCTGKLPEHERLERVSRTNVEVQLQKLADCDIVKNARTRGQRLVLRGWYYDLESGLLEELVVL